MNHSDVAARMADYLDGALSLADRALFDAHLDGCEACVHELSALQGTVGLLRSLPDPQPPNDLARNVIRRIEQGEGQPTLGGRLASWFASLSSSPLVLPGAVAAAGLVVAVVTNAPDGVVVGVPGMFQRVQEFRSPQKPGLPAMAFRLAPPNMNQAPLTIVGGAQQETAKFQVELRREDSGAGQDAPLQRYVLVPRRVAPASPPLAPPAASGGALASTSANPSAQAAAPSSAATRLAPRLHTAGARQPGSPDEWLTVLESNPAGFVQAQAVLSLAERELWARELARRAQELGTADRVMTRLRSTPGAELSQFTSLFAAAIEP